MSYTIKASLAQQIAEAVKEICEHDVNFINTDGFIFASTNKKRIGSFHAAGFEAGKTVSSIEVETDKPSMGIQQGVNIPFLFRGEIVAVIGISGCPNQVRKYARLAQQISTLFLKEHELDQQEQKTKNRIYRLLHAFSHKEPVGPEQIKDLEQQCNISIEKEYRSIVFHLSFPGSEKSSALLLTETEQKLHHLCRILDAPLFSPLSSREYFLLLETGLLKKALPLFKTLTEECGDYLNIGIGLPDYLLHQHSSYQTALLALYSLNGREHLALYDDLTLELLLGSVSEKSKQHYLSKTFGGLEEKKKELLKVYFSSNSSLKETCDKLYIHKNTLQYQLDRIYQITGFNPRNFQDAVILYLALKLESVTPPL